MKIAFFVGSIEISGGSYVIFQHALHLRDAGHEVTLVVLYPWSERDTHWHPAIQALRLVPIGALGEERFDLALATWWRTALDLHQVNAARYGYFVQSIESRFYPEHEGPLRGLVDATYDFGLPGITEADWIRDYLRERHGSDFALVHNGIRKDLYRPDGPQAAPRRGKRLRVLVEGSLGVPFKNVGRTLKLARAAGVETWLLTGSDVGYYPGVSRVFSRVPIHEVPAVYRACDVLVKLSFVEGMFGPPLEMFHCGGTAIVYDVTGHDQYMRHEQNGLIIRSGDEAAVVAGIRGLDADRDRLRRLQAGARATADAWPDWARSSARFAEAVLELAGRATPGRDELRAHNQAAWARYVPLEQARLAGVPTPTATQRLLRRIIARVDTFPRLARARRIAGYWREGA